MMASTSDDSKAFLTDGPTLDGAPGGPLHGLTFAAKDLFDVRLSHNQLQPKPTC